MRRAQKEKTYLMLDQYTRGKVERQIVDFDKKIKAGKGKKPKKGKRGDGQVPWHLKNIFY